MARRIETISVNVDIDVDDVLDELTDERVFQEAEERKSRSSKFATFRAPAQVVTRAINLIRAGDINAGLTELEREFLPKWADKDACEAAYQRAMALRVAA
jgi:hypothetical protein